MGLFLGYRDKIIAAREHRPEEITQIGGHLHHLTVVAALRHPDNGIQRIVEKMRVNLFLVELQLRLPEVLLLLPRLLHQSRNLVAHPVQRPAEHIDFFQTAHLCPGLQLSASQPFGRLL